MFLALARVTTLPGQSGQFVLLFDRIVQCKKSLNGLVHPFLHCRCQEVILNCDESNVRIRITKVLDEFHSLLSTDKILKIQANDFIV
jgi:hypothetical protein